jgi:HPr kinase/phosphorylase
MAAPQKLKRPSSMTVREFLETNQETLRLKLLGSEVGFDRKILEPSVNRPGLALSGFFTYFAYKRVQVIGNSEISFMQQLPPELAEDRLREMCSWEIPCLVVARGRPIPAEWIKLINDCGIAVFQTNMVTMRFINMTTIRLEFYFAPTLLVHGCMVDVQGIGILIRGKSGSGKSESVIGLLQKGASLVADDAVRLRLIDEREVIGFAPEVTKSMIEIRGLGILNVSALFGVGSVRLNKRLDLIVDLVTGMETLDMERVGVESKAESVMGVEIARVELPVMPGRDVAGLIEIAALNYKLRAFGYNSAVEFDQRLLKKISNEQIG